MNDYLSRPRLPSWIQLGDAHLIPSSEPTTVTKPRCRDKRSQSQTSRQRLPHHTKEEESETVLVQLIRKGKWLQVVHHCQLAQQEAYPNKIVETTDDDEDSDACQSWARLKFETNQQEAISKTVKRVYYQTTALELFVASNFDTETTDLTSTTTLEILSACHALLVACPWQVRCGEALRATVMNTSCPLKVAEMLLDADAQLDNNNNNNNNGVGERNSSLFWPLPAVSALDKNGLCVLDHILESIQIANGAFIDKATQLLDLYLKRVDYESLPRESSPLVKLFSLGTSFGIDVRTMNEYPSIPHARRSSLPISHELTSAYDTSRVARVLDCTRKLLDWKACLVTRRSTSTGCTALHVALRNYGNCTALVRALMEADTAAYCMTVRNHYGDLPLHVACAVGVPLEVLHLVLARTIFSLPGTAPHPLIWSRNAAGYTPVDLEWIRHIEAGNGFNSHRSFYPLDARAIRKPTGRDGDLYNILLRQAVDQVIETEENRGDVAMALSGREIESNQAFGLLLHRIFLIIRSAFYDSFSLSPVDLSGDILHLAAALSSPLGPSLPRPILDLIYWQYPEELRRRDHLGRLPLHYCFKAAKHSQEAAACSVQGMNTYADKVANEWKLWVQDVLHNEPSASSTKDNLGRLPLHYALEMEFGPRSKASSQHMNWTEAASNVLDDLLRSNPDSVDSFDLISGLYAGMMAASNGTISLDSIYKIIRTSPGVIANSAGQRRVQKARCRKRTLSYDSTCSIRVSQSTDG